MRVAVRKWGNSLALRIPKSVAEDSRLELGAEVELTPQAGRLIVTPIPPPVFTLKGLLAGVTNANRHREIHTRSAVGREVW